MARIPGIQIEKDSKGRPTYARINLKKCKEATPFLEQLGAFSDDDFEKEWATGLTLEEAKIEMRKCIDKLPWKPEQR